MSLSRRATAVAVIVVGEEGAVWIEVGEGRDRPRLHEGNAEVEGIAGVVRALSGTYGASPWEIEDALVYGVIPSCGGDRVELSRRIRQGMVAGGVEPPRYDRVLRSGRVMLADKLAKVVSVKLEVRCQFSDRILDAWTDTPTADALPELRLLIDHIRGLLKAEADRRTAKALGLGQQAQDSLVAGARALADMHRDLYSLADMTAPQLANLIRRQRDGS